MLGILLAILLVSALNKNKFLILAVVAIAVTIVVVLRKKMRRTQVEKAPVLTFHHPQAGGPSAGSA